MFCSKCGNEIKEGENFCSKCGTKVIVNNDTYNNEPAIKEPVTVDMKKYLKILLIGIPSIVIVLVSLSIWITNGSRGIITKAKEASNNSTSYSNTINKPNNTTNTTKDIPTDDVVISCAKTALRNQANYEPEIGTTKVVEKDKYGRYLVLCYAKLVNAFGAGKYQVYYIVLSEVSKKDGEWYYKINPANGIIDSSTYFNDEKLAIDSAKQLNQWNEAKDASK